MPRRETRTGGREATDAVVPGEYALSIGLPPQVPPDGFAWRKLTDIARLESGHTPSRSRPDYWDGGIPWIGIRDATSNHGSTITDTMQHVSQLGIDNSSARVLPAGTVCLSRTASVGYVLIMGVPMATSQDFVNWVCGPDLSPSYLRYILMVEQESVRRFAFGSVHQTLYYPDAKALHVCVPSRHGQDAISSVLGAVDDKIAANLAIVAVARDLAMTHFIAALRSLNGYGVKVLTIGALADAGELVFGDGYRTKRSELSADGYRIVRAADLSDGFVVADGPDTVSPSFSNTIGGKAGRPGDVVLTTKGTVGRVAYVSSVDEPIVYSPQICYFRVVEQSRISAVYLRYWFESDEFRNQAAHRMYNTDMAPYINLADIRSLCLTLPAPEPMRALSARLQALEDMAQGMFRENRKLAELRDTLLPELMSGRLRVRDAEEQVGAVV